MTIISSNIEIDDIIKFNPNYYIKEILSAFPCQLLHVEKGYNAIHNCNSPNSSHGINQ